MPETRGREGKGREGKGREEDEKKVNYVLARVERIWIWIWI